MRVGMIGLSEGNGHPFSFSAIINGYDRAGFAAAGWPVILAYLERQPAEAFGLGDARVTHAWTQDAAVTAKLCAACHIATPVTDPQQMLGQVDALIVARDDWQTHADLAVPFLKRGVPVFVDKPLTLDEAELGAFAPYLEQGLLMSTSGMRYAGELDALRGGREELGRLRLVAATVLNEIEKYGIHMLDAVAGLGLPRAVAITRLSAPHQSYALMLEDGTPFHLDCLGPVGKTFHLSLFGQSGHAHVDLHDNFIAFRRTLERFFRMVEEKLPPIDPRQTVATMRLVRQARDMAPLQTIELSNV